MIAVAMLCGVLALGGCEEWPPTVSQQQAELLNQVEAGDEIPPKLAQALEGVEKGDVVSDSMADRLQSLEAGDPIPMQLSSHPADQARRKVRQVDEGAGDVLGPLTNGWWSLLMAAAGGMYGVSRQIMAKLKDDEAKNERTDRRMAEDRERAAANEAQKAMDRARDAEQRAREAESKAAA
jgi:hypothetical protein